MKKAGLLEDDFGDSREERAFRMWVNSLGIPGLYINSLFEDVKDGLALLKVMDKIEPGCVDWKQVDKNPNHKMKKVGNNNLAVTVGKTKPYALSLVGLGGSDIVDGNKKLILGLVWQLMRHHTVKYLAEVQAKKFGGKPVTDAMIIEWANAEVKRAGKSRQITSFKDPTISDGLFFLDLLTAIESKVVDPEYVYDPPTDEKNWRMQDTLSVWHESLVLPFSCFPKISQKSNPR